MEIPKFLIGDNSDFPESIFVVHTEFPRFIINLVNDEIEWLENFQGNDEEVLTAEVASLIEEASTFYDREKKNYEKE